jgi:alanine dehydrogenase
MTEKKLIMGVIGSSNKENEERIPIHPKHMNQIPQNLRERIFFESGYASKFHISNSHLNELFAGTLSRDELFAKCDIILLPKPTEGDFPSFREGQILWGWPHCVQGEPITQVGIDKKMTFVAWEAMFMWRKGVRDLHIFHKNNELAGYCSVLHALQLQGISGHYGEQAKVALISFGSVGRGAIHALLGSGFSDITLFTQRPAYAIAAPIPSIKHKQFKQAKPGSSDAVVIFDDSLISMSDELQNYDIIVNAILQDTDNPLMFIRNNDLGKFKPGSLIIDVSCDLGMGFEFARPTSFEEPSFEVGTGVTYYAVDHSPTYKWNSASFEISAALVPFIETVMGGPQSWEKDPIIKNSIEIQDGEIKNPKILSFQKRSPAYPHRKLD